MVGALVGCLVGGAVALADRNIIDAALENLANRNKRKEALNLLTDIENPKAYP